MDVFAREKGVYIFEPFRLDPVRRALLRDGGQVRLPARLFETLLYLVVNHDRLVERDELQQAIWRGRTVDDNSLDQAISALRKALQTGGVAENLIVTVAGRGYRFGAPVEFEPAVTPSYPAMGVPAHVASRVGPAPAGPAGAPDIGLLRRHARTISLLAVAGITVAIGGVLVLHKPRSAEQSQAAPPLSIVVIPFRYLGGDRESAYLADAVSDDLTTYLGDIPRSLVISRSSAEAMNGRSAAEIGRTLGARYLVEGSVQQGEHGVRVNARLVGTDTGLQLWATADDAAVAHVADTLPDMVHRIVNALDTTLVDAEVARAARERPHDLTALDQFFRGRSIIDRARTLDDVSRAQSMLEASVKARPDFVEALSTLGALLVWKGQGFEYPTYARDLLEANDVIGRALKLAPRNPGALAAHGRLLLREGRCEDARGEFDAALAADPGNLQALVGQAVDAWFAGRPQDVFAPLQAALRVDPLGPASGGRYDLLGFASLFTARPQQAIGFMQRSGHLDAALPTSVDNMTPEEQSHLFIIAAYAMAGDFDTARRRYQAYRSVWPNRTVWRVMAYFNPAQMRLPGFHQVAEALAAAGMPRYDTQAEATGTKPAPAALQGGDFTATPGTLLGGEVVDTRQLENLMAARPPPMLVDAGRGVAVPPGAIMLSESPDDFTGPVLAAAALDKAVASGSRNGVVVMNTGAAGIDAYNEAQRLISLDHGKVYWYRGGEEAWAAANTPANDRRTH